MAMPAMPGRILVTGAAGFIGSHLVERLAASGQRLVCLDSFDPYYRPHLKRLNLAEALAACDIPFVEGDIRDRDFVDGLIHRYEIETVAHLAARAGVRASLSDPYAYFDINVNGTLSLLEACKAAGVRKFIFASSSSVYGAAGAEPAAEDMPLRPLSPYGASKVAGEALCQTYAHLTGMSTVALRFFTVYGPRQRPDMAIRKFAELIDSGQELTLYGDGHTRRDYTYIADIIQGLAAAITVDLPGYQVFNLGGAQPVELASVVSLLEGNMGKAARVRFEPLPTGEPTATFADVSRAEKMLGFRPAVRIEEGLARFVRWYKERCDALAQVS